MATRGRCTYREKRRRWWCWWWWKRKEKKARMKLIEEREEEDRIQGMNGMRDDKEWRNVERETERRKQL